MAQKVSHVRPAVVAGIKSAGSDHRIWLNKKVSVTQDYFDFIGELTGIAVRYMKPCRKYLLKEIFGNEFWDAEFFPVERRIIGMCVARMVRNGHLPLDFIKKKSKYPLQYQRK